MRLARGQVASIKRLSAERFGAAARMGLFGSRVRDDARGGDVDLLVELSTAIDNPAWQGSLFAAQVSRAMHGRQVDVVLAAPNLRELPIHALARREGVLL